MLTSRRIDQIYSSGQIHLLQSYSPAGCPTPSPRIGRPSRSADCQDCRVFLSKGCVIREVREFITALSEVGGYTRNTRRGDKLEIRI